MSVYRRPSRGARPGRWALGPALLLLAPAAGAQSSGALAASASGGGARAVSSEHAHEYGYGGWASGTLGMRVGPGVTVGASAVALALPRGDAPPQSFATHPGATLFAFGADVRARPWDDVASDDELSPSLKGFWLGGSAGAAITGGATRFMLAGHAGYDFWLAPRVGLGPTVSMLYVAQPDNSVRPEDAVVALVGARLVFDPAPAPARTDLTIAKPDSQDRDRDGISDLIDRCPDQAEDLDGTKDDDGCPEDDDGDGIPDVADACRSLAEDLDGFQDEDGCPESDNDRDGIDDAHDRCPNEPEDRDGFQDDDGCPEADNDQDGWSDAADRCPNEAETKNGHADEDGCPDEESIRVSGNELVLDVKIAFVPELAPVRKGSYGVLEQIARLLARNPQYAKLTVEAYADGPGNAAQDLELSEQRAASIGRRLREFGVAAERLEVVGRGHPTGPRPPKSQGDPQDWNEVAFHVTRRGAANGASTAEGAQ